MMYLILLSMAGFATILCIVSLPSLVWFCIMKHFTIKGKSTATAWTREVVRFTKENRANCVCSWCCYCLPFSNILCLFFLDTGLYSICPIKEQVIQTCNMLNSLANPRIYCWEQKEMRESSYLEEEPRSLI